MKSLLIGKDPDAGIDWRQEEKGATEDEMVGWHHRLTGHEFERTPGVGDRQGSLECCSLLLLLSRFSCVRLCVHELQHASLPCPSPSPRVCSNSCTLSWWCHPTILSFVVPFSSCFQSFPASGFFQMSQLFASGGQNIGASASASVSLMHIQY